MSGRRQERHETAYRNPRLPKVRTLYLTEAERAFLLYRMADVTGTVEAVLHRIVPVELRPSWDRKPMVICTRTLVASLREHPYLHIIGRMQEAIVVEAIEGNRYFVRPADDPRLAPAAIRQARELRRRLSVLLGRPVHGFQVGIAPETRGGRP